MKSLRLILSVLLVLFLVFALSVVGLAQEENEKTEITIAGGSVGIELELTKKAARMFEEELLTYLMIGKVYIFNI